MAWYAIGTAVVGLVVNLAGQNKAKKAARVDAEFDAAQRIEAAGRSRAVGQRSASEERRNTRLLESALQARAMGGGGDVSVSKLEADIAGEGEYRALAALYEGDSGAAGLEKEAEASRRTGRARATAANYQMAGTIINTGSQMYSKYSDAQKTQYPAEG